MNSITKTTGYENKIYWVYFKLVGTDGRTVAVQYRLLQKGSNTFSWDIANLAAGNYFLVSTSNVLSPVAVVKR